MGTASSSATSPTRLDAALIEIDRACGSGSVIRDPDVLVTYAQDESGLDSGLPDAVVRVRKTEQALAVMRAAYAHDVFITPRAAGTGRVGGALPIRGGIVLAFEQMNQLKGIEKNDQIAFVEPGLVTGQFHAAVEEEGFFYPPDPNSWATCSIGGNLSTNAGGPRAFKYGVTRNYALGMQVITPTGELLQLGKRTRKGVTGYDLTALMVGSEGTLGVITEATIALLPKPETVVTLLVFLPDESAVEGAVSAALKSGVVPRCIELIDRVAIELIRPHVSIPVPPDTKTLLIVELDGSADRLDRDVEVCGEAFEEAGATEVLVAQNAAERERLWAARRELAYTLKKAAKHLLSEDVVVPRTRLAALLERCRELSEKYEIVMPTYGHAGDGNLHVNFLWDDPGQRPAVDRATAALFEAVIEMGGTLSGEHGIGLLKAPYLPLEQSAELIGLQRRIKSVFDPKGLMNPGKVFPTIGHGPC